MNRINHPIAEKKLMSAEEAALLVQDGMNVITSGFTPSGYPKAVPLALAKRVESGERIKINLFTGASVGDELDGALTRAGAISRRTPYQTHRDMRKAINEQKIAFSDVHLSLLPQQIENGFYGEMDIAIVEALAILEDGSIIPTTSVGISPTALSVAKQVIVEVNHAQPEALEGLHDIYMIEKYPARKEIPIYQVHDRIGSIAMPCDPQKIVAVVETEIPDDLRVLAEVDDVSQRISQHLIRFFEKEVALGRLSEQLLPLQSGVGSVSNAVLLGLEASRFEQLSVYSEVIQDCVFRLIETGKVIFSSGASFTPSLSKRKWLHDHLKDLKNHCVLRPMAIANHPEIIRRLGVIAMNTALEADIYGHVNSTHVAGSRLMNGIGGSGDFARNAHLSIFTGPSTAMGGKISSIVPMVSHVDHTEHDVHILVTEQGVADLRGLAPIERAVAVIENCAHPHFRSRLHDYLQRALSHPGGHQPHLLEEALSWHARFLKEGSM
ncbi:MAG TPA: succinate CoA transferase [Tissierellia bacterium]|nr:succinate CoA transferase [Tissierellia bacterium]